MNLQHATKALPFRHVLSFSGVFSDAQIHSMKIRNPDATWVIDHSTPKYKCFFPCDWWTAQTFVQQLKEQSAGYILLEIYT